ncbi:MAG TPA: sigma factor-like helix-turn-helix DNA-binding protein [Steroidobacteraceae bacterium]|nr:sigma factor-like helix-turn-helix DNA-binding protein [Steroidobacteraceae bacterium]
MATRLSVVVGSSVADQLLATLAAPLRETLVLREVQELSYREIAEVTEVSIGTVMSRLAGHAAALSRS